MKYTYAFNASNSKDVSLFYTANIFAGNNINSIHNKVYATYCIDDVNLSYSKNLNNGVSGAEQYILSINCYLKNVQYDNMKLLFADNIKNNNTNAIVENHFLYPFNKKEIKLAIDAGIIEQPDLFSKQLNQCLDNKQFFQRNVDAAIKYHSLSLSGKLIQLYLVQLDNNSDSFINSARINSNFADLLDNILKSVASHSNNTTDQMPIFNNDISISNEVTKPKAKKENDHQKSQPKNKDNYIEIEHKADLPNVE